MGDELSELKKLSEKITQRVENSPGAIVQGGNYNTAFQTGQFTQTSKDQVQRYLAELQEQVESHKEQLPKAEAILSDISQAAQDLADDQPDAVSIITRLNLIVKRLIPFAQTFPALVHLGDQLLRSATSIFQK